METLKIIKRLTHSPIVLAIYLLTFGVIYFSFYLLGYTFVPASGPMLYTIAAAIIILLTVNSIKHRNERTKTSGVFSALLPLIAVFYTNSKYVGTDTYGINNYLFILNACIVLICGLILFGAFMRGRVVKAVLLLLYTLMLVFIFLMLFIMIFFGNFGFIQVEMSVMSPNSVYLAEIVSHDQGALGGATYVSVTRQNRVMNFLVGKFRKEIYWGRWGAFENMELRWESDNVLYINNIRYTIRH
ncbi:MAG: DUF5412 family protein [Oscillospiraceae bacterium]|nr:DUF5412 family protein [Oscillospiraceae bacterium]